MIVSNSGPLIWPARYDLLDLLSKFFKKVIIPPSVYKEAVTVGMKKCYKDSYQLKSRINNLIFVKSIRFDRSPLRKVEKSLGIESGKAEEDCILLAKNLKSDFLTNDEEASIIAGQLSIKAKGILWVLLKALKEKILEKAKILDVFELMIEDGFWINPETVLEFRGLVEKYGV